MKTPTPFALGLTLLQMIFLLCTACSAPKNVPSTPHANKTIEVPDKIGRAEVPYRTEVTRPSEITETGPIGASKTPERTAAPTTATAAPSSFPMAPQALLHGSGVPALPETFVTQARQADYILIGEQHTSAQHHAAQAALIALLAQNGLTPAIGLEMIPATLQSRLDAFNARHLSLDDLAENLDWENVWGFDFALYRPIFAVAEQYNIPVYGLNIEQSVVKSIRKHGSAAAIPAHEKQKLPPVIQYPGTAQYSKLERFFKQHATMLMSRKTAQKNQEKAGSTPPSTGTPAPPLVPGSTPSPAQTQNIQAGHGSQALKRFITIQSLWDSTMAYNATKRHPPQRLPAKLPESESLTTKIAGAEPLATKVSGAEPLATGPLIILAGGAHVEYGHGIAYRINHYAPSARCLLVMPLTHTQKIGTGEADFYYTTIR